MLKCQTSKIIVASPPQIYAVIKDYEVGHQAILPRTYFKEMRVLEGGQGAGTLIYVRMKVMGQSYEYTMRVTEPQPGHLLKETDINTGQYSSFTLDELDDGRCRVTIETAAPQEQGIAGMMQRLVYPIITRRILNEELDMLAEYVQTTQSEKIATA